MPVIPAALKRTGAIVAVVALPITLASCASSRGGAGADAEAGEVLMWTHNAGNEAELGAVEAIVDDFNASQEDYTVKVQAFPQDSYNQSVVAAASSKRLPCILDIDGPNVPNWAWAGYLAPLDGIEEVLSGYLPSTVGRYQDEVYAYGFYDVALTMVTRESILNDNGIRIPTTDEPWTVDEFNEALETLKATGDYDYPADFATSFTGEWWPYAYSPMLQSFGGDLINRDDYKSADGVLNGPEAVEWATWFRSLVENEYIPQKSGADPAADFVNGKTAILYNGTWTATATREAFDDVVFLPSVDAGNGPKIGGASWQWGMSATCENPEAALAYLKFAAEDQWVAKVAGDTQNIPTTETAAAEVEGYGPDGENNVFRQYAEEFAVVRPETPGYPFIATTFTKAAQDILSGADPQQTLDQAVADIDANQEQNNFFE
jgi:multiple sugar transport system substrate-binding protein